MIERSLAAGRRVVHAGLLGQADRESERRGGSGLRFASASASMPGVESVFATALARPITSARFLRTRPATVLIEEGLVSRAPRGRGRCAQAGERAYTPMDHLLERELAAYLRAIAEGPEREGRRAAPPAQPLALYGLRESLIRAPIHTKVLVEDQRLRDWRIAQVMASVACARPTPPATAPGSGTDSRRRPRAGVTASSGVPRVRLARRAPGDRDEVGHPRPWKPPGPRGGCIVATNLEAVICPAAWIGARPRPGRAALTRRSAYGPRATSTARCVCATGPSASARRHGRGPTARFRVGGIAERRRPGYAHRAHRADRGRHRRRQDRLNARLMERSPTRSQARELPPRRRHHQHLHVGCTLPTWCSVKNGLYAVGGHETGNEVDVQSHELLLPVY